MGTAAKRRAALDRDRKTLAIVGGLAGSAVVIGLILSWLGGTDEAPRTSAPSPPAEVQTPVAAPSETGATEPAKPTWARIPFPGRQVVDTPENRVAYTKLIAQAHRGEPPLDRVVGKRLLEMLRDELAKIARIPASDISVMFEDASGWLRAKPGVYAKHDDLKLPICSDAVMFGALTTIGAKPDRFAEVGMLAVICQSDGCTGAINMRPTAEVRGLYGGDLCVTWKQVFKHDLGAD